MNAGSVAIAILAAGASRRLGRSKQLLPYRGTTLLRHAAQAAVDVACGPVIVVVGEDADAMRQELRGMGVRIAQNEQWEEGMSSSIRCALTRVKSEFRHVTALLLMVCDQPLVSAKLIQEIIAAHAASRGIVACRYANTVGVPALFAKSHWDELLKLRRDRGAKRIIEAHRAEAAFVDFPGGEKDIDTVEDAQE